MHDQTSDDPKICATLLGIATFSSGLSPEDGEIMHKVLKEARDSLYLKNALHLSYLLIPTYCDIEPRWKIFDQVSEVDSEQFLFYFVFLNRFSADLGKIEKNWQKISNAMNAKSCSTHKIHQNLDQKMHHLFGTGDFGQL